MHMHTDANGPALTFNFTTAEAAKAAYLASSLSGPATSPPSGTPAGWRSIESAPPEHGRYLTWPDYRDLVWQGPFMGGTDGRKPNRWYDDEWECYPTHWMPLPAAPTQEPPQ